MNASISRHATLIAGALLLAAGLVSAAVWPSAVTTSAVAQKRVPPPSREIAQYSFAPIVRKAETKGLAQISNEMKDYAGRARARKLKPEEYQGGSSAVSNLGMFGIKNFSAVINPPHATILAVGVGDERVIVEKGPLLSLIHI